MKKYLSLVKFSHTIFALPFAFIGFFLAIWVDGYAFDYLSLLLMLVCMVSARTAAMGFNRLVDRDIDIENTRTRSREIPSGKVSVRQGRALVIISSLMFITATYFLNPICFYLSPVALAVVLGYSYTKRFTSLCHLILGIGLGLAPIGAYLSISAEFSLLPVLVGIAVFFWVSGFDIIYALQDEEFDTEMGLNSIPQLFGKKKALAISNVLHVFSAASIILVGYLGEFGILFWIGTVLFSGLLVYQHILVKPHDLSRVNLAFFTLNGIGSMVFGAFVLTEFYLY